MAGRVVGAIHHQEPVAALERGQKRGRYRREPGGADDRSGGALQLCDGSLQRLYRGRAAPSVLIARPLLQHFVDALEENGRSVDHGRVHERTGHVLRATGADETRRGLQAVAWIVRLSHRDWVRRNKFRRHADRSIGHALDRSRIMACDEWVNWRPGERFRRRCLSPWPSGP